MITNYRTRAHDYAVIAVACPRLSPAYAPHAPLHGDFARRASAHIRHANSSGFATSNLLSPADGYIPTAPSKRVTEFSYLRIQGGTEGITSASHARCHITALHVSVLSTRVISTGMAHVPLSCPTRTPVCQETYERRTARNIFVACGRKSRSAVDSGVGHVAHFCRPPSPVANILLCNIGTKGNHT